MSELPTIDILVLFFFNEYSFLKNDIGPFRASWGLMFSCCLKEWHSMRKWFTDSHLWEHHLHWLYFRSYSLNRNESFSIHKDKWQHNKIISQAKKKKFLFMMIKCTKHLQWIIVRKHNLKKDLFTCIYVSSLWFQQR